MGTVPDIEESAMAPTALAEKLLTAEEFSRLPDRPDGSRQELVRGVVVTMSPPPRDLHGDICILIGYILASFVIPNRLGRLRSESGVVTERDPDSVRGPDISYYSAARLPERPTSVYPDVVPDLVVEVLSPSDRPGKIREKVIEYLASGVKIVWLVDPDEQCVTVHHTADEGKVLFANATLTGEDVLPGFSVLVSRFFEDPLAK
jgi:Uma2 family endonuclease